MSVAFTRCEGIRNDVKMGQLSVVEHVKKTEDAHYQRVGKVTRNASLATNFPFDGKDGQRLPLELE